MLPPQAPAELHGLASKRLKRYKKCVEIEGENERFLVYIVSNK
jgi:hypothetical protein